MNRKIIQKIIDELSKEPPRLDYIRGILETVLESLPLEKTASVDLTKLFPATSSELPHDYRLDDAQILEEEAKAKMKTIEGTIKNSVTIE